MGEWREGCYRRPFASPRAKMDDWNEFSTSENPQTPTLSTVESQLTTVQANTVTGSEEIMALALLQAQSDANPCDPLPIRKLQRAVSETGAAIVDPKTAATQAIRAANSHHAEGVGGNKEFEAIGR